MDFIKEFSSTDIDLEYFDLYSQVMYILSSAEISNNLSRYDGIKFGYRASGYTDIDDLYTKTRSEGFGLDAKLTAIMGAVVLSKDHYGPYYEKAMKIRRLIKESINFDTYKVIVLPCRISDDPYENLASIHLLLAGLLSVSFSYKGHGIQLVAGVKKENLLYLHGGVYGMKYETVMGLEVHVNWRQNPNCSVPVLQNSDRMSTKRVPGMCRDARYIPHGKQEGH